MTREPRYPSDLERALEHYRQAQSPPAGTADRVWAAVEADVAPPAPQSETPPALPVGGSSAGTKLALLAGAVAIGGALWLWAGGEGPAAPSPKSHLAAPAAPASTAAALPSGASTSADARRSHEASGEPVEVGKAPASVTDTAAPALGGSDRAAEPEALPSAYARRAPREGAPPTSTLSVELALLTAAQSALDAGDPRAALELLQRHRRRFPKGALAEEREAARVEALCGVGRRAAAVRAAAAFAERYGGSPRVARVTQACQEPAP